jgi:hypothetical protein
MDFRTALENEGFSILGFTLGILVNLDYIISASITNTAKAFYEFNFACNALNNPIMLDLLILFGANYAATRF